MVSDQWSGTMMLARRNLLADRVRFLLSLLGVAVSVGLILLLAGYRSGVYIDLAGAGPADDATNRNL